ncbi:uncharacterized protein L969DRAFT_55402 [Mixia osmundae IAM 14324]|uniref:Cystathionine beta-lyase n=1 Tax=Mixia osmundae (strain CBS 9802 / IAM 14324 / JCM 22182 / KY 12970) TaxID=764103 RepID=G7E4H0_MIXOS|nr:uncharacterized protein L969DRAFT_55402 [Mixia osmundae IAM 14324]KEI36254.1 hypothetical protein L969DRAFT_55402 [Mixia osmundae IAM 14324]GAA97730.1 hypothetical protein E5Q_04409 [Mixia osmundae IAM 14324]
MARNRQESTPSMASLSSSMASLLSTQDSPSDSSNQGSNSMASSSATLPSAFNRSSRRKRRLARGLSTGRDTIDEEEEGMGLAFSTQCATVENPDPAHKDQWNSSSVPIYQSSTFKGVGGTYDYSRSGNPTRGFLQHHVAKISGARHAFAVASGMGALDVIFRLLTPGDEIIAGNDLYGGSNRLLTYLKTHGGITVHHIDTTRPELLLPVLTAHEPTAQTSKVKLVLIESPTNPLLQVADIAKLSDMIHQHAPEAMVVVDNTMMSPYLQRPLEHGADIVYDSATKYLSGHHDLMAGVIVCDRDDIATRIAFMINSIGNGLAPFDSFLLLRGIKTLALRLDRQQATAQIVAEYLDAAGFKVHYPGLSNHPGREIHERLAKGAGAVLSFETGDKALSERIVGAARLWGISVSFGCVNSLISMPCLMSHASIDPKVRAERNLPEDLIRLCVGIEDTDDLIDDLEAALLESGAIRLQDNSDGTTDIVRNMITPPATPSSRAKAIGQASTQTIVVSAPGKVILFGEHAVVHGITAIAGSVDLRCFCMAQPRYDGKIGITMPDVGLDQAWDLSSLPPVDPSLEGVPEDSVDASLLDLIRQHIGHDLAPVAQRAAEAFLYLFLRLSRSATRIAQHLTVRSTLPIGAGLGSSAAFSVCISSALLYTHGYLPLPSSEGKDGSHAAEINEWAFLGEKILHGNPSGVDNSVATYGGAVAYTKATASTSAQMDPLRGFKSIRFLLTDTRVSRDTKTLVAGVTARKTQHPFIIDPVLRAIQDISAEAKRCLTDSDMSREDQISTLEHLIDANHLHLNFLGVGHSALEIIVAKTRSYQLHSKLTGAGGGGCAVTLIPDGYDEAKLKLLKSELGEAGFECFETTVGGSGISLLIPQSGSTLVSAEGGAEQQFMPNRSWLETTPVVDDSWHVIA